MESTYTSTLESIADDRFRRVCEAIVQHMQRLHVPGVAIGIADGDADYTAGFGVTSIEHPLAIDADTLFQIGSTTKTVTGTAAMRLVEQDKLDLDAPVRTYLPELRLADEQVAASVTTRHLFNHTGGWAGDYFDDMGNGDDALARIVAKLADLPQLTPLGAVWSYNNAGFYLAGRLLEAVAGKPYEAVAHELVLAPLGMSMSFFFAADAITHRVAIGHDYHFEPDQPPVTVARPWALARTAHPAGGICSTVRDQLRYARFHMGDGTAEDGTRLLAPESIAEMQAPRVPAADGQFFGVTWFINEVEGTRIVRHGGATNGQLSAFVMVPARRFAITILTNADRGDELNRIVVKLALREFLTLDERDPQPLDAGEEQLGQYAGRYESLLSICDLELREGGLMLQMTPKGGFPTKDSPAPPAPPPTRLALYGDDRVIALDEPFADARGEFLRNRDGSIAWLRIGGRVHARAE
jgi:CubicO group peptidase (beta-lactamase class C family)